jgi:DNA-binding transcriptional ArsR family regulator
MITTQRPIDRIFHALGDPTRRAFLEKLSHGPAPASSLAKTLKITLAAVIQHLHILEASGLARTKKIGRVRICEIEPKGFSVAEKWIADRRLLWERRYDKLGQLLSEAEEDEKSRRGR